MPEPRFLLVRLSSLGDIVHTLPAASALRDAFPEARIDWLVDAKWRELLEGNPDLSEVISVRRNSLAHAWSCIRRLRAAHYTHALDFQSLYKSAVFVRASGAPQRIGFDRGYAREAGATFFYTRQVHPAGTHKVEHNLSLAEGVGAQRGAVRFPFSISAQAESSVARELARNELQDFVVMSPGGGWRSKCWPPARFGDLHRDLNRRHGWRSVIVFGPGEESLAEEVRSAAGMPEPVLLPLDLSQLMALTRRAKVFVAADTGPLHLASALGAPVVGLYGPTDPARNGPYGVGDIVVHNATSEETTYRRGREYSPAMLSITVEQVAAAIGRRLSMR
jgi:heptosyltransferase I